MILMCFVTPIDDEAPKGRLITPQVQSIRAILDKNAIAITAQTNKIPHTLDSLKTPPDLVICDSQCLEECLQILPKTQKITTFSMIFAEFKGDFTELLNGANIISSLRKNDEILISEVCSHNAKDSDIARVKIPKMLEKFLGFKPKISYCVGNDFPDNLKIFKLVIHCGACMLNRKAMISRIKNVKDAGVAITNYGMTIQFVKMSWSAQKRHFFAFYFSYSSFHSSNLDITEFTSSLLLVRISSGVKSVKLSAISFVIFTLDF
ncbi:small GTP-binding protein domain [Campylobacter hominis ATCC BAA-381]|uniref:Small GTP-binding protein domain n=1 Tax=Campylobacter hominis (strain ATCC BAA-381 / DSM 21671 / CCUG 45161 / LMG 19568 / NCTC 13146 / CH001A) TaxID=360107 RepID=A7I2B4_CAMHC|nr:small GTP-binding protein domain [Campylobacter hominis ATCC BAA-381]